MIEYLSNPLFLAEILGAIAAAFGLYWVVMRVTAPNTSAPLDTVAVLDAQTSFLFEDVELIDATDPARQLLDQMDLHDLSDWTKLRSILLPRFPTFPEDPGNLDVDAEIVIPSNEEPAESAVEIRASGEHVHVSLVYNGTPAIETEAERHRLRLMQIELATLRNAVLGAPYPIWEISDGKVISWANNAYLNLIDKFEPLSNSHLDRYAHLFATDMTSEPDIRKPRQSLIPIAGGAPEWFEVSVVDLDEKTMCYALKVTEIVKSEQAQRNFVQTLTKTFAQLSIGLAVFDKNRQLALFNPALIDLTQLPADFLSARPNLLSLFDRLRDIRMMPEPKNYGSWRKEIADLVAAATDGRYQETWNLPNGQTFRVTGRPHPDGAVAFLIEDISAEISLARRFRSELETTQNALNSVPDAIAIFSASGTLTFSNLAYGDLWNVHAEMALDDLAIQEATHSWRDACITTNLWSKVTEYVLQFGDRTKWSDIVTLQSGGALVCSISPLTGGATMVRFTAIPTLQKTPTQIPCDAI